VLRNALDATSPDVALGWFEAPALDRLAHHHLARARTAALAGAAARLGVAPNAVAEEVAPRCAGSSAGVDLSSRSAETAPYGCVWIPRT
jgi:hypothetical protein